MPFHADAGTRRIGLIRAMTRAPRAAAMCASVVLVAVGLESLLVPPPSAAPVSPPTTAHDLGAAAFAEAFARAYFTFDADTPELRERALARFMPEGTALPSVGPPRRDESVQWSTVAAAVDAGVGRRRVTVVLHTSRTVRHISVTVARAERGVLFVDSPPAVVGAPLVAAEVQSAAEREVDDAQLRGVAVRVVKNYLAGERDDLAADLDPRAVVSLPETRFRVASTDSVTWTKADGRVAVAVTAVGVDGLRLALRYELEVVRRGGRWLVKTVHVNPAAKEAAQ